MHFISACNTSPPPPYFYCPSVPCPGSQGAGGDAEREEAAAAGLGAGGWRQPPCLPPNWGTQRTSLGPSSQANVGMQKSPNGAGHHVRTGVTPKSNPSSAASSPKHAAGRLRRPGAPFPGQSQGTGPTRAFLAEQEFPRQSPDPPPAAVPALGAEDGWHAGSLPRPAHRPCTGILVPMNWEGNTSQFSQGTLSLGIPSYF